MICRNGASLQANSRQLMQNELDQSTESVTLPNGNIINTTMLGSGRMNLHTNNNRLGVSESTNNMYLSGMKNHQEPDFTNVSVLLSITPSTAASSQIERDRQFAIQLQSGEDTRARAEAAATPAQSQINAYAAMDNGGGKMGSQQQPCIYLDGRGTATQAWEEELLMLHHPFSLPSMHHLPALPGGDR